MIDNHTAYTFTSITPAKEPTRCSMDWTHELQVMPSTPRATKARLPLAAMTASPKQKERKGKHNLTDKNLRTRRQRRKPKRLSLKVKDNFSRKTEVSYKYFQLCPNFAKKSKTHKKITKHINMKETFGEQVTIPTFYYYF